MKRAEAVHLKFGDELVAHYDNVIATGYGCKCVGGEVTDQPAVILFVREKHDKSELGRQSAEQIVPQKMDGVPVDVIEVGDLTKMYFTARVRPVTPGYSVGHRLVTAGTLGGLFLDRDDDVVALSNNHVLAYENRAEAGEPIFQPGSMDCVTDRSWRGWTAPLHDLPYFATLKSFVPLIAGQSHDQDSAVAVVPKEYVKAGLVHPNYPTGVAVTGFSPAAPGRKVQKFGRTTGHTTGQIMAMGAKFTLKYDVGDVTFEDCIVTTPMSRGGDSGSVLLDENMNALGLLFAGSNKVTLFNRMEAVCKRYGLKVWNAVEPSPLQYADRLWRRRYVGLTGMQLTPTMLLLIESYANSHSYLECDLAGVPSVVSLDVYTGTDVGSSWGPGMSLTSGGSCVKLNVRPGDGSLGGWNGASEVYGVGRSECRRWYTLRMTRSGDRILCDVTDKTSNNGKWTRVLEGVLPDGPATLRIGKLDVVGGGGDNADPGPFGRCQLQNLVVV